MSRLTGIVAGAVLVALFVAAAVLNAESWLMGSQASTVGLVATLVALVAWPVHGVWVGSTHRGRAYPWQFPVVFWSAVVVLAVGGWFWVTAGPGSTVSGGISLLGGAALFVSTAPFHGLSRMADTSGSLPVVVGVSALVLAVSLLALYLARRKGAANVPTSTTP